MTFSSGKRKNRRTSGSDIDPSSSRSRSSVDPRRPKTTDDIDSTSLDPSVVPPRSESARPIARSQSDTQDSRRPLDRSDRKAENGANGRDGDRLQRRQSLSDLVATIDPATTTIDRRLARSRTLGADTRPLEVQPFDEDGLAEVLKRADQLDGQITPALQEAALNEADDDGDDQNTIELQPGDLDVLFQTSAYSEDQQTWRPVPPEVNSALERMVTSFTSVEQIPGSPGSFLAELLPNVRADSGSGVSRELLNDAYFLAKEVIAATTNNPLIDPEQLSDGVKQNIEQAIELVNAIDKMPGKEAFLSPENAQIYNAQKLSTTSLGASSLTIRDQQILRASGSSQSNLSFSRTQSNPAVHSEISDYRRAMIERLETDLDALKKVFQGKLLKKEQHRKVLEAETALRKALDRMKPLLDNPSDPNTQDAETQLALALDSMSTIAQTYISIDRKSRIQDRIDACKNVHDRIDQLRVTDDNIIATRLNQSADTIEEVRRLVLQQLGPEAARTYSTLMEDLFFNASPDAGIQTLLDSISTALGLGALDQGASQLQALSKIVSPFPSGGAAFGLMEDLYKAVSFIQEIKKGGGVSQQQVLQGGLITTNALKNAGATAKAGIDIANVFKDVGDIASKAASGLGAAVGGLGAAIGLGFTIHGGMIAYKTNLRVKSAQGIEDENIRAQVLDRIKTKRLRAIVKAVGGTVAIAGGVVACIATAGVAVPVIAAIGIAIGVGLTGAKAGRAIYKKQQGTKGTEREELATEIFKHMNDLLVAGDYNKAKELAQALTNNKFKQNLMLRGADGGADLETKAAALGIMRQKLKTW
jgi:hypothetical protein